MIDAPFGSILRLGDQPFYVVAVWVLALAVLLSFLSGRVRTLIRRWRARRVLKRPLRSRPRREHYDETKFASDDEWRAGSGPIVLDSIEIRDLKSLKSLDLAFTAASELSGKWTCIAGINGSGKSSILQAICLILLGNELATDLGRGRLSRMSRRVGDEICHARLTAVVRQGPHRRRLTLPFSEIGIDENGLREDPQFASMQKTWKKLRDQLLVSYGATRNLSSSEPSGRSALLPVVQQQLSLFDPLTEIASADALLSGREGAAPRLKTLRQLLRVILELEEVETEETSKHAARSFQQRGAKVEAIDLPDGLRSTVAWLADLCAAWHETAKNRGQTVPTSPEKIAGIVLIDEIGLHLHPQLERAIVPRLRRALPLVQFIVTTHSPMVLASFDRREIQVLDADSETGLRPPLDRQIFGFSMDDVYEYLMGTSPASTVIEELLDEGTSDKLAAYLYQSKDVNEEQARDALARREALIRRLDEKKK